MTAYTNAQLTRREAGDRGIFFRELFSGDGATVDFLLRAGAILAEAGTYSVKIGATLKTETTDYVLDKETGQLTMIAAPAAGTDNLIVFGRAVELSDGDITEALRQHGLTGTDTADVGYTQARLLAAADLADWRASFWASAYDISEDGESLSRSGAAAAWEKRAEALRKKARQYAGLTSTQVTKIDGYNINEVTSRDVLNTQRNARQRYYYVDSIDRLP